MGLFDIFKKKNNSKQEPTTQYSNAVRALGGVHEIIDTLWGADGVKRVVSSSNDAIKSLITEEGVRRKTDLLEYGLELCLELISNAKKNPKTTLGGNSMTAFIYYRVFFECVLALDTDIVDVNEHYAIFQITKQIPSGMHLYVQTMIKIYDILDRGIVYLYKNMDTVTEDYFTIVAKKIRNYLNSYTDDNTGWNKIVS